MPTSVARVTSDDIQPSSTAAVSPTATSSVAPMWPDREGHHQPAAAPHQLGDRQQAHQAGQPDIDGPGVDDERADEQGAEMAVAEVVQVRAGMADDPVLRLRPERHQAVVTPVRITA